MNVFHKVAVQTLKRSPARTIVTIIGVVLSAAMITAVATFGVSLLQYMTEGAAQKYGGWHVAFPDVDAAFVQARAGDKEAAKVTTFQNLGYAMLDGGKNPDKPYLFLAGFSQETYDGLPIRLISGRLPENSGEVLVPSHIAGNGGVQLQIGDTLTLALGTRMAAGGGSLSQHDPYQAGSEWLDTTSERTFTVVGICQRPTFEERSAPGYTLITADGGGQGDSLSLFVTLTHPSQASSYASTAAGGHASFLNDEVLRFLGLSSDSLFNAMLYAVGGIVIAIIMVGSIFLIYNSFSISLNERTQQTGVLASVGATARQLRGSVLFEGFCIGLVGIPLGVLVGLGCMGLVLSLVSKNFGDILYSGVSLSLVVSFPALLAAAAVSLVTILISAYLPAKKAASQPVMDCIRQTNEVKVEAKALKTSPLTQRLWGLEGTLALKNFKRNKKRYRSIVLSLILSVVLFISTSAFVTSLKQASEQAIVFTTYNVGLGSLEMEDSQLLALYDQLKTASGVQESAYQTCLLYTCTVSGELLSQDYWQSAGGYRPNQTVTFPVTLQFLDDNTYLDILHSLGLPEAEYTGPNGKVIAQAKLEMEDNRLHEVDEFRDLFTTSSAELSLLPSKTSDTASALTLSATFVSTILPDIPPVTAGNTDTSPYYFQVVAPWSRKDTLSPPGAAEIWAKGMTFQSETPGQSTTEMKAMLEGQGISVPYTLANMYQMLEESRNYIFIANVFAYTFIAMISLIAVANVFNTISTNIKLRRRELAMLRSVGMADRDFNKMMRFECAFYGLRALLIGLPLAILCAWLIYKGMVLGGAEGISFVMPWRSIGISVLSVLLVIFITMMYAVSKLKKENIIDALRDEMS